MAQHDFTYYRDKLKDMQDENSDRNKMFRAIDSMVHNEWELPDEMVDIPDIRAVVDTTPGDALTSASIALASILPRYKLVPHGTSMGELKRANDIEFVLTQMFANVNKRSKNVLLDKVTSALRYNMVVAYIDDMHMKLRGKNDRRSKRSRRLGRFKERVYPASRVYPLVDEDGVIDMGYVESFKFDEFYNKWRDTNNPMAKDSINRMMEKVSGRGVMPYVQQMYYMDDEDVVVWASWTESIDGSDEVRNIEYPLLLEENDLPFFPWSIEEGSSFVETQSKYKLNPLLAVLYHAGTWENSNIVHSLAVSETIRRVREPRDASYTRDGKPPEVDRLDGNTIAMRVGEQFQRLTPSTGDPMVSNYMAMIRDSINRSTGASILGDTATLKSDTPFATYSAMLQVALGRLDITRDIIARSCVKDALIMAEWVEHSEIPFEALRMESSKYAPMGSTAALAKDMFDIDHLYMALSCDIKPKVPTDRQQEITAAIQLMQYFGYPKRQALEDIGVEQPELIMQEGRGEQMDMSVLENHLREMQGATELEIQAKMMEMQNKMAQEAQAEQQGSAQAAQQVPNAENLGPTDIANAAFGSVNGQMFNPAAGGNTPALAQPGMGREQISGKDRMGREL